MKLEVGMYVRIQWGNGTQTISKCTNKVDMGDTQYSKNDFYIHTDKRGEVIYKSMIVKTSHNIIDLIQIGDYVNGVLVESIYSREEDKILFHTFETEIMIEVTKENVNNIVTKEQFGSMSYRVEE